MSEIENKKKNIIVLGLVIVSFVAIYKQLVPIVKNTINNKNNKPILLKNNSNTIVLQKNKNIFKYINLESTEPLIVKNKRNVFKKYISNLYTNKKGGTINLKTPPKFIIYGAVVSDNIKENNNIVNIEGDIIKEGEIYKGYMILRVEKNKVVFLRIKDKKEFILEVGNEN